MGRQDDKKIERFLRFPADYTYDELVTLLSYLGFDQQMGGRTGGSRRVFINEKKEKVYVHEPHPGKILGRRTLRDVYSQLRNYGFFKKK